MSDIAYVILIWALIISCIYLMLSREKMLRKLEDMQAKSHIVITESASLIEANTRECDELLERSLQNHEEMLANTHFLESVILAHITNNDSLVKKHLELKKAHAFLWERATVLFLSQGNMPGMNKVPEKEPNLFISNITFAN